MHAAVVTDTAKSPEYGQFPDPEPRDGFVEVRVVASAVHQLVRTIAAGRHYSSAVRPPFVPGTDGVVELADGSLAYAAGAPAPLGMLAERTLVPQQAIRPLPEGLDPALAAAVVNPGFSAWLPLSTRLQPGQTVLVLGATGASGGAAVQIAKALGAGRVVAAGRNQDVLHRLGDRGADATVDLGGDLQAALGHAADGYDIVLDYVWGEVAERALAALVANGIDAHRPLDYVDIGGLAGPSITLDAAWLRSSNLHISGSGIGSSPMERFAAAPAAVLELAGRGLVSVEFETHALADVESTWTDPARLVYLPSSPSSRIRKTLADQEGLRDTP